MPRYPDPAKSAHQQRQRRYRKRLVEKQTPEADTVDAALAASLACYIHVISTGRADESARATIKLLLRCALKLLTARGYDRLEAVAVLRRRLVRGHRRDLEALIERSRIKALLRRT
ncbi:hypothetical protein [Mesorhizobium sp. A623]